NVVYFGSVRMEAIKPEHSLPGKLGVILQKAGIRDRVKGKTVAIKMHLGYRLGYSTVHPIFVREIVKAVKEGGGKPFVTDVAGGEGYAGDAVSTAFERGYTPETLGCPIYPIMGLNEKYGYPCKIDYKGIKEIRVAGMIHDADFLISLVHVKGHNICGLGGAFKNIGIGCIDGRSRIAIHKLEQFDPYWDAEKCTMKENHVVTCPVKAISYKDNILKIRFDQCISCMNCVKEATDGCISINHENFDSFQEAMAITTKAVLSTFTENNTFFINVLTDIHPYCDCYGLTTPGIVPDIGIVASDNIVSVEQATLDLIGKEEIILKNVPPTMIITKDPNLHPFQMLFGPYKDPYVVTRFAEKIGLGTCSYTLDEIFPVTGTASFQRPIPAPLLKRKK
ncbi:MAG: DUF362 domain-containing protein, partial [Candidatus Bathyarchaeia archaeon]